MLSRPNKALAARDPALPGLGVLLDDDALARAIGRGPVRHTYLRYKPGTSCLRGITIETALGREWFAAKAYTSARFAKVSARSNRELRERGVLLLPERLIAILPAACDRKVRAVRGLLDPSRSPRLLESFGPDATLIPLKYKPGRRLVARLHAGGQHYLLKAHADGAFARALPGAIASEGLGGPPLAHCDPKTGLIVCDWLEGETLSPEAGADGFAEAGRALARMHAQSAVLPGITPHDKQQSRDAVLADAAALSPAGARLSEIARRLGTLESDANRRIGPCHGDFSYDQCLVTPTGIRFVDWDRAALGDQGGDIGSFLARLDAEALWGNLPQDRAETLSAAFLQGYAADSTLPPGIAAHRAHHLILLATEPFRRQVPDWEGALIRLGDTLAKKCTERPVSLTTPGLSEALAPEAAAKALRKAAGVALIGTPRVVRHKPGRRALVRYPCQAPDAPPRALLGKLHVRKHDARTPALHAALRRAGLDGRGQAGVPRAWPGDGTLRLWFMEEVPGTNLADHQLQDTDPAPFFRTGRALARLHSSPVTAERAWTHGDEIAVLEKALTAARSDHDPAMISCIGDAAAARLSALASAPVCLIHRDFYPDQVLVDGPRIWLLDLDLAAMGDPAIDVGNFLAHLIEYALRTTGDPWALRDHADAFLEGYFSLGARLGMDRVIALRDVSLLRHIHICTRFEDRRALAPDLLRLGAQLISRSLPHTPPPRFGT